MKWTLITIWIVVFIIVVLGYISVFNNEGIIATTLAVLWCSWAPLLFATLFQLMIRLNETVKFIMGGAFIATSGFAIYLLGQTAQYVITWGPLHESALILIVMPIGFAKFSVIGAVGGGIMSVIFIMYRKIYN